MFSSYFSGRYILSKKALFSLVLSDRSDGKTFDCKARALEDYERDKSITIYMRRYKTEISSKMYMNWFNEVITKPNYEKYKNWEFKYSKNGVQVKNEKGEWDDIVYFIPLSMTGKTKSQITEVERIHTIDFDEYYPLDGRFLKEECKLLLEFWKSIDRDRDTTQMIILGNKVSPFMPIFDYFDIEMEITKDKIRMYRDNSIAVQIYANKEHREFREKSKFRSMIKGTTYEDYDSGGILNMLNLKLKSRYGYELLCSFKTERGEGTIWKNSTSILISPIHKNKGYVITDKAYNINREFYVCNYGKFSLLFRNYYRNGNMFFENEKAFYLFEKILLKCSV